MMLNQYQTLAMQTCPTADRDQMLRHALCGLMAECGELVDVYYIADVPFDNLAVKECGDIMWALAEYCTANGWQLGKIIERPEAKFSEYDCMQVVKYLGRLADIYRWHCEGHRISETECYKTVRAIYKAVNTVLDSLGIPMSQALEGNIKAQRRRAEE